MRRTWSGLCLQPAGTVQLTETRQDQSLVSSRASLTEDFLIRKSFYGGRTRSKIHYVFDLLYMRGVKQKIVFTFKKYFYQRKKLNCFTPSLLFALKSSCNFFFGFGKGSPLMLIEEKTFKAMIRRIIIKTFISCC